MKSRRINYFLKSILLISLIFSTQIVVFTQKVLQDKNPLIRLEKNIDSGKIDESEKEVFSYVVANPKDAKGFALLAKLRHQQNRLNEAKSLANRALSLDTKLVSAKITLALVNFKLNQIQDAQTAVSDISESDLQDNSIRLLVSKTLAQIGDCVRALQFAEKLPLKIKNNDALPLRAECFLQNNDRKNLSGLIPIAKASVKTNQEIVYKFAEILFSGTFFKETSELLKLIVSANPKNSQALLLLARSEIYLQNFNEVKLRISQAEKLEPKSNELIFVKAIFENEQGNPQKALELLEKDLEISQNNIKILSLYALTAIRANQAGKAFRASENLIKLEPENPDFIYLYGASALQSNRLNEAESSLKKFLEIRPKDDRGCIALGLTFAAQPDKLEIARNQMLNCLTFNPNNFEAAYQLGLSYKTQGDFQKAIDFLEQTTKLSPNYAAALRDLGAVYLQINNETKARIALEKSVAINPSDSDTHFQLSRLYNLIGERELAKKHLELFQKLKTTKKEGM